MHHLFRLADEDHEAALTRPDERYRLHLQDCVLEVELREAAPGLSRLIVDGQVSDIRLVVDGDTVWVQLDGVVHELRHVDPVARYAGGGAGPTADAATAPMPGTAIVVAVAAGQAVRRGDTLVVIESMKLETSIPAWRDGRVAAVHVALGDTFDRGAPLVTLVSES